MIWIPSSDKPALLGAGIKEDAITGKLHTL